MTRGDKINVDTRQHPKYYLDCGASYRSSVPKGALLPKRSRYSALLSQMQHAVSLGAERSRAIRLKAHDGSFRSCS